MSDYPLPEGPQKKIQVKSFEEGNRLDVFLARVLSQHYSRTQIQKMILEGRIQVNQRQVSPHYRIKLGETIEVGRGSEREEPTRAEAIPLDILYEDEDLLVVDKPAGMVVHPAHGHPEHTLVNALLYHVKGLSHFGDPVRPGIVHRLDKDTSGLLVVAKHEQAHASLARQFKEHSIERAYLVAVQGVVQHDEGLCEEPVGRAFLNRKKVIVKPSGGKDAVSFYRVLKRFSRATLVEVQPKTGRTHQIRVHMAHLGHPVLGDALYGVRSRWIARQAMHAYRLGIMHPQRRKRMSWESPLPNDMQELLRRLESAS